MKIFKISDEQKNTLKIIGNTLFYTFFSLLLLSFLWGINLNSFKNKVYNSSVKTLQDVSVSITERNQLLITNWKTGEYSVYSDSVLQAIFNKKATELYKDMKSTKK